ncbi:MAG: sigma-70 family RNA polymerase sigma factor [Iamia sp.]
MGPTASDRRRAHDTVPRGTDAHDTDRAPGVDLEVWLLHVGYQRTGETELLRALVEEYAPYATSIALQLVRQNEPLEDVRQVAMEALVSALQRFDVERALPFPALARPTIVGAIKRHYRDRGWSIRTPRAVHELATPLRDAQDQLAVEHGRPPTTAELADALGVEEATVSAALQALRARTASSLDQVGPDGGPPRIETLGELDRDLRGVDEHLVLQDAMAQLDERERRIVGHYYYEEMSQREIGALYGVSQMQVSRWISSILARLRGRVGAA